MKILPLLLIVLALNARGESERQFSIGAIGDYQKSAYGDGQRSWLAAPYVHYEDQRFYWDGLGAGVKIYESADQSQGLKLGASYRPDPAYKPQKSADPQRRQLDRRRPAINVDLHYHLYSPWGSLETDLSQDLRGHGTTARVQYGYYWEISPQLALKPALGASWHSGKHNRYYYGINAGEAARSGLAIYRPGASWTPEAEIRAFYRFSPQLSLSAGFQARRLPSAATDSPLTNRKSEYGGQLGLHYDF